MAMRRHVDIITAAAVLIIGAVGALWVDDGIGVVLGTLVVAIAPGYLLASAILPTQADLVAKALGTLALGVIGLTLAGLIMDLARIPLEQKAWLLYSVIVGAASATVALKRRAVDGRSAPPRLRLPAYRVVVLWAAALLLVVVSVAYARTPIEARDTRGYTMLAAFPVSKREILVEVRNAEMRAMAYRLEARRGSRRLAEWRLIARNPGDRWHVTLRLPRDHARTARPPSLEFILFRGVTTKRPYRRVTLRPSSQ